MSNTEKKFFKLVKPIPVVGWIYRITRAIDAKAEGDEEKYNDSLKFDLTEELNPLAKIGNIVRGIVALDNSYSIGIWVGKRHLKGTGYFSLTVSPQFDVSHWSVMIRGIIYQTGGGSYSSNSDVPKDTGRHSFGYSKNSEKEKNSFDWNFISNDIKKSDNQIKEYVHKKSNANYNLWKSNCQTAVVNIIAYALKISKTKAVFLIHLKVGSLLF